MAVSSEQFLERVRSRPYDVVLSDFRMPATTGMDIFELAKKEGVHTPFILVTGSLGDEKAVECLKQGMADSVLKDGLARCQWPSGGHWTSNGCGWSAQKRSRTCGDRKQAIVH